MDSRIEAYFEQERERHLAELSEFLSIPSISSLPEHKEDMKRAAEWLAEALKKAGMDNAQAMPTAGNPVVYAEWNHAPGKPTALIYGHYDVQPVDPLELWQTPPFQPDIRDGQIFARGANDDKGQSFLHIKVVEAFLRTIGSLPVNVKFCLEGEEEIGSPNLPAFIDAHRDLLAADVLVISDTTMLDRGRPTICYGLRGICCLQIDVTGAKSDLHSGSYGGAVQNPIHALVEILSSMHNEEGQVTVKGFYDRVKPITVEEREQFRALQVDEEKFRKDLQVPALYGEKGYTLLERLWARPTLEINGIYGGFQGEGVKTVIPSQAHAKISCRLVPDQDPDEILDLVEAHIHAHTPAGVKVHVSRMDKGRPFVTPVSHPAIQAAARAYEKVFGVTPSFTRMGGSIPIVETFDRLLHLPVVLMGFGYPDDQYHAPNEHFHLECFDQGLRTIGHYLYELENMEEGKSK